MFLKCTCQQTKLHQRPRLHEGAVFVDFRPFKKYTWGDNMDKKAEQPMQMEKKIGNTTYIVTSHFPSEGSTAVDKIKRLIDMDTKATKYGKKV